MQRLKDIEYNEKEDIYFHRSHSKPLNRYKVIPYRISLDWRCSCPDFIFRGPGCKHIDRIKFVDSMRLLGQIKIQLTDDID
ncbi:MAG TPA: SWIM zinc finger family protein [Candidatus Nitrosocosmicus sp.]|nr:SWIM zinc finger family protein [Candidatus Nitrosocosmicus sp.]